MMATLPHARPYRYDQVELTLVSNHELKIAVQACDLPRSDPRRDGLLQQIPSLAPFIESNTNPKPLRRVLNAADILYSAFGIIEHPYVDLEYLDGHAAAFDQCYTRFPAVCSRLHFFTPNDSNENHETHLIELLMSGYTEDHVRKICQYRGFAVLKPTSSHCLGRTRLSFNETILHHRQQDTGISRLERPGCCFLEAGAHTHVHLLCARLDVHAADFIQQDPTTGRCASAAVWGALRQARERFGLRDLSFAEIARKALNLSPAGVPNASFDVAIGRIRGFSSSEIQQALAASGGRPLVFYPAIFYEDTTGTMHVAEQYAKFNLHSVIDSGMAPVVALDPLDEGNSQGHAVLGVGHSISFNQEYLKKQLKANRLDAWVRAGSYAPHYSRQWVVSSFVPIFYINDDDEGPYRRLAMGESASLRVGGDANGCPTSEDVLDSAKSSVETKPGHCPTSQRSRHFEARRPIVCVGDRQGQVQYLTELYVIVPSLVTVEPSNLIPAVIDRYEVLLDLFESPPKRKFYTLWRCLLLSCAEWRRSLFLREADHAIREFYTRLHLPRYIWVFECTLYESECKLIDSMLQHPGQGDCRDARSRVRRLVHGEILCDATSPEYVSAGPVVAARLMDISLDVSTTTMPMNQLKTQVQRDSDARFYMNCVDIDEIRKDDVGQQ